MHEYNKSPGDDEIFIESIKFRRKTLMAALRMLFNLCFVKGTTPSQWDVLIHKKGDITCLGNHRLINLLSQVYKLFTKILSRRLTPKLNLYQPYKQAGFMTGYGTSDNLQVTKVLIENCIEYNKPLLIIFVERRPLTQ